MCHHGSQNGDPDRLLLSGQVRSGHPHALGCFWLVLCLYCARVAGGPMVKLQTTYAGSLISFSALLRLMLQFCDTYDR